MQPQQSSISTADPLAPDLGNQQAEETAPEVLKVPEPNSLSHARKMAKTLFGPLARIWVRVRHQDGEAPLEGYTGTEYEVGTQRGDNKKLYGIDENLQKALQKAVETINDMELKRGKLPRDVIPFHRTHAHGLSKKAKSLQAAVNKSKHFTQEQKDEALKLIESRPSSHLPRVKPSKLRPGHIHG